MTLDLVAGILDWRSTNASAFQTYYAMQRPPYQSKSAPFETVDELRLVYGANMDALIGEDANRNGALDANENDADRNGILNPGALEHVTVYSREPNTNSDGAARLNIRTLTAATAGPLLSLLQTNIGAARAAQILAGLFPPPPGGGQSGTPPSRGGSGGSTGRGGTGS